MNTPARAPLINRPLVGILAIAGTACGIGVVVFDSFNNPWGGSLVRVGVLLGALWLFLAPTRKGAAPTTASIGTTAVVAALALLAVRGLKPGTLLVLIVFGLIAFFVRPRKPRV
jgi:hypothetical protein